MSNENKTALTAEEIKKATEYLKQLGIHPSEPIYWDTDKRRIMLDELLTDFASLQTQEKDKEIDKWSDRWAETNNQLSEVTKERDVYKSGIKEISFELNGLQFDKSSYILKHLIPKLLTPTKE